MTPPFLHIDGVRKTYGSVVAADNVELRIDEGEFMTLLGPSGSGKSTTLYALAGFLEPAAGDIKLRGTSLLPIPSHKRNIGMVFQRYTLFPHLPVGENVAFPLRVRRRSRSDITARVRHMLELVRLQGFEDRMPATLSGGQQQRVALARALVYEPPVLLMDEPLSALDKKLREEIQLEIRRIHRETGVTILYVTHDQEEALRLSDKIAVFDAGRVAQVGTGPELYANPASHFVADFIGDSAFLRGSAVRLGDGTVDIEFPDGTRVLDIALHGQAGIGQPVELMLRPERLNPGTGKGRDGASLAVTVNDITFLGDNTMINALTEWREPLSSRLPFGHPLIGHTARGDRLWVTWPPDATRAFPCS